MKKLIGTDVYEVVIAAYAVIKVAANSSAEAMEIAEQYTDTPDEYDFDSREVHGCDKYPVSIGDLENDDVICTSQGEMDVDEYLLEVADQESRPPVVGWDMTDQLELWESE